MEEKVEMSWEKFKCAIFVSGMVSYGLGFLAFWFKDWFPVAMLGFLFHPTVIFFVWKKYADNFLKEGIKK